MGTHYDKLTELSKAAIDWHVREVLSGDVDYDKIGDRSVDVRRRREEHNIAVIHPDEYRRDLREFYACDQQDVSAIETQYIESLRDSRRTPPSGKSPRR